MLKNNNNLGKLTFGYLGAKDKMAWGLQHDGLRPSHHDTMTMGHPGARLKLTIGCLGPKTK